VDAAWRYSLVGERSRIEALHGSELRFQVRQGQGVQPLALVGAFRQHGRQLARAGRRDRPLGVHVADWDDLTKALGRRSGTRAAGRVSVFL
jgi:hypothetical protein